MPLPGALLSQQPRPASPRRAVRTRRSAPAASRGGSPEGTGLRCRCPALARDRRPCPRSDPSPLTPSTQPPIAAGSPPGRRAGPTRGEPRGRTPGEATTCLCTRVRFFPPSVEAGLGKGLLTPPPIPWGSDPRRPPAPGTQRLPSGVPAAPGVSTALSSQQHKQGRGFQFAEGAEDAPGHDLAQPSLPLRRGHRSSVRADPASGLGGFVLPLGGFSPALGSCCGTAAWCLAGGPLTLPLRATACDWSWLRGGFLK